MSVRLFVIFFPHKVKIKTTHRRSSPPYKKFTTLIQKNLRRYVIQRQGVIIETYYIYESLSVSVFLGQRQDIFAKMFGLWAYQSNVD
jgi:hypothetical protein